MNKNLSSFVLGSFFTFGFLYSRDAHTLHILSSASLLFFLHSYITANRVAINLFMRHEIGYICGSVLVELLIHRAAPLLQATFLLPTTLLKKVGGLLILVGMLGFVVSLEYFVKHNKGCYLTSGPYGYMRHPVYFSALLYMLGAFVYLSVWITAIGVCLYINRVVAGRIRIEEDRLAKASPEYKEYKERVYSGILWYKI